MNFHCKKFKSVCYYLLHFDCPSENGFEVIHCCNALAHSEYSSSFEKVD